MALGQLPKVKGFAKIKVEDKSQQHLFSDNAIYINKNDKKKHKIVMETPTHYTVQDMDSPGTKLSDIPKEFFHQNYSKE